MIVEPTDAVVTNGTFDTSIAGWTDRSTGSALIEHSTSDSSEIGTWDKVPTTYAAFGDAWGVNGKNLGLLRPVVASGTLSSVSINLVGYTAGGTVVARAYADNAGSPGTQIGGDSDAVVIGGTGTKTFTWSSNAPALSEGTSVWFVVAETTTTLNCLVQAVADQGASSASGRHDTITSIADQSGGVSATLDWRMDVVVALPVSDGALALVGSGSDTAHAEQAIAVTDPDAEIVVGFTVGGQPHDAVKLRIGTTSEGTQVVDDVEYRAGYHIVEFTPGATTFYLQFLHAAGKTITIDDVRILDDEPLELAAPWAAADVRGVGAPKWTGSYDDAWIVHRGYPEHKLLRFGHRSWSLIATDHIDGPYLDENADDAKTLQPSATTGVGITITAAGHMPFRATDPGRLVTIKHSATWGYARIVSFVSPTEVVADVLKDFGATTAQPAWKLGVWSATTGYPDAIGFHEERLVRGGATNSPGRFDGSKTGSFDDFTPGTDDADPLAKTVTSDGAYPIRWVSSGKFLLVGTARDEVRCGVASESEVLTPASIPERHDSRHGSENLPALRTGDATLMVERGGGKARDANWTFENERYRFRDLTRTAEHITESGIVDWTYQQRPWSMIWAARADGVLIGCVDLPEEEIIGWNDHPLGGSDARVVSLATIAAGNVDQTWLMVERTVNGALRLDLEVLAEPFPRNGAIEDAIYLDAVLQYDEATPKTSFSGADHLAGETCDVLADGAWVRNVAVSVGGAFTLAKAASKVTIGYPHDEALAPRRPLPDLPNGTARGLPQRIVRVRLNLLRTAVLKAGPDEDSLEDLPFGWGETMDAPPKLGTGWIDAGIEGDFAPAGSIEEEPGYVVSTGGSPFPATLRVAVARVEIGEG